MKTISIRIVLKNYSKFPIDTVWENAKDLEHVGFLHSNTNAFFQLLHVEKSKDSPHEYDTMVYRTVRKLKFLRFNGSGFRKIISEFNIRQVEYVPFLKIYTCLNSLLFVNPNPNYPTVMVDEVVLIVPWYLGFLSEFFRKSLLRHTRIQCLEDEPFRARRTLLKSKGIKLPFSLFNQTFLEEIAPQFQLNPHTSLREVFPEKPELVLSEV